MNILYSGCKAVRSMYSPPERLKVGWRKIDEKCLSAHQKLCNAHGGQKTSRTPIWRVDRPSSAAFESRSNLTAHGVCPYSALWLKDVDYKTSLAYVQRVFYGKDVVYDQFIGQAHSNNQTEFLSSSFLFFQFSFESPFQHLPNTANGNYNSSNSLQSALLSCLFCFLLPEAVLSGFNALRFYAYIASLAGMMWITSRWPSQRHTL